MKIRLIDANALTEAILKERRQLPQNKQGTMMKGGIRKALKCIGNAPTIHIAPVTILTPPELKCKDCRFWCDNGSGLNGERVCLRFSATPVATSYTLPDDFCSYGEWRAT